MLGREKSSPRNEFISFPGAMRKTAGLSHVRPWKRLRFWLMWPGLFIFFTTSHRARVVLLCDDKILLVKDRSKVWFEDDRWTIPGGGIRAHEDPLRGGARELYEELGIEIDASLLRPLSVERVSEYGLSYRGFFMMTTLTIEPGLSLERSEIAYAQWFPLDEARYLDLKKEASRALELLAANA